MDDSSVPRLALWVLTMSRRAATAAVAPSEDATRAPLAKRAKKRHAEAGSKAAKAPASEAPTMRVIDWNSPGWREVGQRVWHYWDGDKTWCAARRAPRRDPAHSGARLTVTQHMCVCAVRRTGTSRA